MTLIAVDKFTERDVLNNEKSNFIFKENEKKEGGDQFLRECTYALPLTMKSAASYDRKAYWSDVDYRHYIELVSKDIDRISNVLNLGGTVFLENRFLQEEENGPMRMTAPKILDFIIYSVTNLLKVHQPKHISPNLRSPRTPYATQN